MDVLLELLVEIPNGLVRDNSLRQVDGKCGALAVLALHSDLAAHHLQQVLRDGKAQARTLDSAVLLKVHALELAEKFGHILRLDADACVLYSEHEPQRAAVALSAHVEQDAPLVGVLHGVVQDIHDGLAHAYRVPVQPVRQVFVNVDMEVQALLFRLEHDHVRHVVQDGAELVIHLNDLHPARLDLGEVQNIVDDGQQVLPGALHVAGVGGDALIPAFADDHLVHAQHCVDGGADLVGHTGQELALGGVSLLRLNLR